MSLVRTLRLRTAALNTELTSSYLSIPTRMRVRRYVSVHMGPYTSPNNSSISQPIFIKFCMNVMTLEVNLSLHNFISHHQYFQFA